MIRRHGDFVAGLTVAAAFGGSNLQVSGPAGAMTVVLVPIMHTHGASGVLIVGMLAGRILIGPAVARAGRYMARRAASSLTCPPRAEIVYQIWDARRWGARQFAVRIAEIVRTSTFPAVSALLRRS
ncbi:hypothetical protein AB0F43_06210 [Kribbella sp. NPDC023972]|uniref:hypothetical protein n=1 Tax=Kribbella sp. NPDC023972 TaxID=3154795 RepID=UPI0033F957CF